MISETRKICIFKKNETLLSMARAMAVMPRKQRNNQSKYVLLALILLLVVWIITTYSLVTRWKPKNTQEKIKLIDHPANSYSHFRNTKVIKQKPESRILSRSNNVTVTADVRGNLGPASVVIQRNPGKDWIKDRWQAASDMHGTNIPGTHWILLDFGADIIVDKIVLDWEAAFADKYKLEGSMDDPSKNQTSKWTLFDGTDPSQEKYRSTVKTGQSPGVKTKTPLHVIHTIFPIKVKKPLRYLRLYIQKSAMGWGVSLWQFDVFGNYKSEVVQD